MKTLQRVILLAIVLVGLALSTAASASATTRQFRIPFEFTTESPCTGERVRIEGELHAIVRGEGPLEEDGFFVHVNFRQVDGVGLTSGRRYVAVNTTKDQFIRFDSETRSVTIGRNFRLVSQGSTDNFIFRSIAHATINATGEVSADFEVSSRECLG
jgi:hypothetical protein